MTGNSEKPTGKVLNHAKQARYARSHERLKLALEHGFYIEASMICESIICDRLHSNLHWRIAEQKQFTVSQLKNRLKGLEQYRTSAPIISLNRATLKILIDSLALDFDDFGHNDNGLLPGRLDAWREKRNAVTHQITYTSPTRKSYERDFDAFMREAETCAVEGRELVRMLTNWDSMARRRGAAH